MARELVFPPDFQEYAWEVEAKGVFWDATVRVGDLTLPVIFYDPVRLAQDVQEELAVRPAFVARRLLVVPAVTVENMRRAVSSAPTEFFS